MSSVTRRLLCFIGGFLVFALYVQRIAYKDNARLAAMAVDLFNVIELVEDLKGTVRPSHSSTALPEGKTTPTATRPMPLTPLISSSRNN
jgi:hypothetical protein